MNLHPLWDLMSEGDLENICFDHMYQYCAFFLFIFLEANSTYFFVLFFV